MDLPSAGKLHLCPVTSTQGEEGLSLPSSGHTDPANRDARFSLGLTRTAVMARADGRHFPNSAEQVQDLSPAQGCGLLSTLSQLGRRNIYS